VGPHRQEGHLAYVPAQFCLAVQGSSRRIIFFEGTKHKRARCPSAPWASRRRRLAATPCYSGSCSPSPTARAALATSLLFKKFPYRQRNNGKLLIGDKGLGFRGILFLWTKSPVCVSSRPSPPPWSVAPRASKTRPQQQPWSRDKARRSYFPHVSAYLSAHLYDTIVKDIAAQRSRTTLAANPEVKECSRRAAVYICCSANCGVACLCCRISTC
jgi:hypothetical protein